MTALILAVLAAATAAIVPIYLGRLKPGYSHMRHTLSELGETGSPVGWAVSLYGILTGLLIWGFVFFAAGSAPQVSREIFFMISLVGAGYIGGSIFPCDKEGPLFGSWSTLFHNIFAGLEYVGAAGAFFALERDFDPPLSIAPASAAERRYMGVWQKDSGANIITSPLSFAAFLEKGKELTKQGLRLSDVERFETAKGPRYVGVWRGGSGSNLIFAPLGPEDFQAKRQEMIAKGLRLEDFEIFLDDKGHRMVLGVWRNGTGAERWEQGLRFSEFVKHGDELIKQGLRLVDVETLGSGKSRLYFGLWQIGKGSNLIVGPLHTQAFGTKRKEMTAQGLRLSDLEVVRENGAQMYISVWSDGPAANGINLPLNFEAFVARGESMVKKGYRLTDVETFEIPTPTPTPSPQPGGGGSPGSGITFSPLPSYIRLSNDPRLIVDFSTAIDDPPRITIPTKFLPLLPTNAKGEIIFPDNFCGIRVIQASRFVFLKNGKQVDEFPFNNVPENSSIAKMFGDNFYLGGIDFTGPIGACASASEAWRFFFPFTKENEAGGPPDAQVKLVIEMETGSKIEFLNFLQIKPESLSLYEIFKDETEEKMRKIEELLLTLKIDSGYCGIDAFVQKMCEDAKQEGKPGECLIAEDFESPC